MKVQQMHYEQRQSYLQHCELVVSLRQLDADQLPSLCSFALFV